METVYLELEQLEDHFVSCPKCSMLIQFSGFFDNKENTKCPWCTFDFIIERLYK